jgi:hypothetical protein
MALDREGPHLCVLWVLCGKKYPAPDTMSGESYNLSRARDFFQHKGLKGHKEGLKRHREPRQKSGISK